MDQANRAALDNELIDESAQMPLRHLVNASLEHYFAHLDGEQPTNLYGLVLEEMETALIRSVMNYTENNQSHAAKMLGISRNTLRKKLEQYAIA